MAKTDTGTRGRIGPSGCACAFGCLAELRQIEAFRTGGVHYARGRTTTTPALDLEPIREYQPDQNQRADDQGHADGLLHTGIPEPGVRIWRRGIG